MSKDETKDSVLLVNAMLHLLRDPTCFAGHPRQLYLEVPNEPGGPIDILSVGFDRRALATECKSGAMPDASQHANYLGLTPGKVALAVGGTPVELESCYLVMHKNVDHFVSALDEKKLFGMPVLVHEPAHEGEAKIRLHDRDRFVALDMTVAFKKSLTIPDPPPRFIDIMPDCSDAELKTFVLGKIPAILTKAPRHFTSEDVARRIIIWELLVDAPRNLVTGRIDLLIRDLRDHEFENWIAKSRGKPQTWSIYVSLEKPRKKLELMARVKQAGARWGVR